MTFTYTGKDDWATPQPLFDSLNEIFHFEFDCCASTENTKCPKFYTKLQDALSEKWPDMTTWCNPPYSRGEIQKWIAKCYMESKQGRRIVMLIPAATDTKYFQTIWQTATAICFKTGRVKFVGAKNTSQTPSAIVIFGRPLTYVEFEPLSKIGKVIPL